MNDHYWIAVGSENKGPYTLSQLQNMWRSGAITADALYFQEGMQEWQPISRILRLLEPPPIPVAEASYSPRAPSQPLKSPGTAAVLSFFIPGLGQIYNGQIGLGIAACVVTVLMYFTIILGIVCHIICICDAYRVATKMNEAASR